MATIVILSSSTTSTGWPLNITTLRLQISGSDYSLIQSNPNALNFVYGGIVYNVNGYLYPSATVPPYGTLWQLSTSGGNYYVSFLVNPSIPYFNVTWTSLNFPYALAPIDPNYISVTYQTDQYSPVYNPVVYKFFSPKYNEIGYRYLVDVKTNSNNLIGRIKVVPLPDGSGYVDLSKILSNYVTKDFTRAEFDDNAANSYLQYKVEFGEEYLTDWDYTNLTKYNNPSSLYNGYTVLNQANSGLTHTYIAGDQITVSTISTGTTASVNGLHDVVAVPATNQIVIDVPFPTTGTTLAVSGSTIYSDSRKTGYSNLTAITNKFVYNGVFNWKEWKAYSQNDYILVNTDKIHLLLTNIEPYSNGQRNLFRVDQQYYLNYIPANNKDAYHLYVQDNLGNDSLDIMEAGGEDFGYIRQFRLSFEDLLAKGLSPNMEYFTISIMTESTSQYTNNYRFYIDRRCAIENNYIYFMDKLGSILSLPFTLRENESIDVERETFNQQTYYDNRTNLNLSEGGDTIHHMSSKKTYTLNTNWMNDEQMELFEIMMESPYTWFLKDGVYFNCIIEDKSTELEKRKNKKLFKKTIKVYLSNQDPLNI